MPGACAGCHENAIERDGLCFWCYQAKWRTVKRPSYTTAYQEGLKDGLETSERAARRTYQNGLVNGVKITALAAIALVVLVLIAFGVLP